MRTRTYTVDDAKTILDCCDQHGLCVEAGETDGGKVALTMNNGGFRVVRSFVGADMPTQPHRKVTIKKGKKNAKVAPVSRGYGRSKSADPDTPDPVGDR